MLPENFMRNTIWNVSKYGVFSGPCFPTFGLNTERYFVSIRVQSKCGKVQTTKNSVFGHFSRNVKSLFHFKIKYILSYDCVRLFSWSFFKNPREICVFYGLSVKNPIEIRDTPKSMGDSWEKIKFREPPRESGRVENYVFLFLTFQYLQVCCDQMIFMWNIFYQSIF